MKYSLSRLFESLDASVSLPVPVVRGEFEAGELFAEDTRDSGIPETAGVSSRDFAVIAGLYSSAGVDLAALPVPGRVLHEVSINAFDAFVHAWMSELPVEAEMIRFGRKILIAAKNAGNGRDRAAAENAASDRGDSDVRLVLEAAYKVWHEVHRMYGFLRFAPGKDGQYIARCAPDYFVLPALGEHFTLRFGETPWAVVDDKRRLRLCRGIGEPPVLRVNDDFESPEESGGWEELWRQYHKTINNESRNNPGLQRRFMPKRYWKNLPEMR